MCLTRHYYVNGFAGHFSVFGWLANHAAWLQFKYLLFAFFFFFFICALLGEFIYVSLFTSVTWQSSSALIRGVPNPQTALQTSYANPSLHRPMWTRICTSVCPMVYIYTSICNMSPSHEYFSKCCCTCLIACQKQSLGESLSLPK